MVFVRGQRFDSWSVLPKPGLPSPPLDQVFIDGKGDFIKYLFANTLPQSTISNESKKLK